MIEWSKEGIQAAANYRHELIVHPYKEIINYQVKTIQDYKNQIKEFSELITKGIKEHIERIFGDLLAHKIKKNIFNALRKVNANEPNKIIRIPIEAVNLRFLTPNQIEHNCLKWFYDNFTKYVKFSIGSMTTTNEIITAYRVVIPEMIYNCTKPDTK